MRKNLFLLLLHVAFFIFNSNAQAPQAMNYQSVARNASGGILANQNLGIRITIQNGSGGPTLYQETHSPTTNQFGLFTLAIGSGTVVSGNFSSITWNTVTPWLQVEMDPTGGSNYINMGTSQLLSVPYAFSSANSAGSWSTTGNNGTNPAANFIGTTDNQPLRLRVNNTWAGEINPASRNTSFGLRAGQSMTTGVSNVAIGSDALKSNTTISNLVAVGDSALFNNGIGASNPNHSVFNTAVGSKALYANTTGSDNSAFGYQAMRANTTGALNAAFGNYALEANTSATSNTAIGSQAMRANTIGSVNTAVGTYSLYNNSSGGTNAALGVYTLFNNTTGSGNTAGGYQALFSNSTGNANVAIGFGALFSNTTGSELVAIGDSALYNNTSINNTAVGSRSLLANTTGGNNSAVGTQALKSNTSGNGNTAAGFRALSLNSTGSQNAAFGVLALYSNINGPDNTAVGYNALRNNLAGYNTACGSNSMFNNTSGGSNTSVGYESLNSNTAGNFNTAIGMRAYWTGNFSNSTAIGYMTSIGADNQVHLGNTSISSIQGQVGFTTYSDARVKENVTEDVKGLEFINRLRPVTYHYDIDKENDLIGIKDTATWAGKYDIEKIKFSGFIAQEVEEAAENSNYEFSGVDKSGTLLGLRYAEFVVPLVKAVQELSYENKSLKSELENTHQLLQTLQADVQKLKNSSITFVEK